MDSSKVTESPVLPADHKWTFQKRKGIYESEVTALVRCMLEDDAIREDQSAAWERWRNDPANLK
ncbi:MAG TPA: hypothetical protein VK642_03170 [Burkholderiales bacterium]|nr:hypothetical protein [Burkholderiales bacterium]